jgi:hypothetical protein
MTYSFPENFNSEIRKNLSKKFRKDIKSLFADEISISYGKSILNLCSLDSLRLIFEQNPGSQTEKLFKNFLIKNFSDAERTCPGSGFIATVTILEALSINFDHEDSLEELIKISYSSHRGNLKDLHSFLKKINRDASLLNICEKILFDGGFSASCSADSTYDLEDYTSLDKSTSFKVRLDSSFCSAVRKNFFKNSNVRIIIADGTIESVSEIHHVLEHFSQNKTRCFLICRGFSDSVISTLATNYLRGSLKIIPAVLTVDIESINSLKDICIATGADLISTLKGDSISNIDVDEIPVVSSISIDEQSLQITNPERLPDIIRHTGHLRELISEESLQDKIDLLEKRITSLMPRKLNIYFSNHDKDSVGLKKDKTKIMIAMINSYCKTGRISLDLKPKSKLLVSVVNEIKKLGVDDFPAMMFFEGIKAGITNAAMLKNSSKIILLNS